MYFILFVLILEFFREIEPIEYIYIFRLFHNILKKIRTNFWANRIYVNAYIGVCVFIERERDRH